MGKPGSAVFCPYCGGKDVLTKLEDSHSRIVYSCRECNRTFEIKTRRENLP